LVEVLRADEAGPQDDKVQNYAELKKKNCLRARSQCLSQRCGNMKTYHVYIMSNISKMLYTGVTNDLEYRVLQHKTKMVDGFTKKYNIHRLVYFEAFGNIKDAITREKQIKGWLRVKKVALIESVNPNWNDLAADWLKRAQPTTKLSS
jgi:putative endonuclease